MNFMEKIGLKILTQMIPSISPTLRAAIDTLVKDLYTRAKSTDNQFDDFLVLIFAGILGVDLDG